MRTDFNVMVFRAEQHLHVPGTTMFFVEFSCFNFNRAPALTNIYHENSKAQFRFVMYTNLSLEALE